MLHVFYWISREKTFIKNVYKNCSKKKKKKWYFSLFLSIILLCIHRNTSVLRKLELSLSASLCVLYSIVVSDGKLKCFFIVSLNYVISSLLNSSHLFLFVYIPDFKIDFCIWRSLVPNRNYIFWTTNRQNSATNLVIDIKLISNNGQY